MTPVQPSVRVYNYEVADFVLSDGDNSHTAGVLPDIVIFVLHRVNPVRGFCVQILRANLVK